MTRAEKHIDEFVRLFLGRDDVQTGLYIELEALITKYLALERAATRREMEKFVNAVMNSNQTARKRKGLRQA